MSTETIGYKAENLAQMPEIRQNMIDARILPRLNPKDMALSQTSDRQLDFIASVLS